MFLKQAQVAQARNMSIGIGNIRDIRPVSN